MAQQLDRSDQPGTPSPRDLQTVSAVRAQVGRVIVGQDALIDRLLDRAAHEQPRADRGRPGPREDAHRLHPRAHAPVHRSRASSSRRTCSRRTSPARWSSILATASSPSGRARSSRTSCSPTRSTARLRRCSPRCSRRCRSARSPSAARRCALPDAVPRARHAEPDRARGHLPAAGGAARPLHAQGAGGLPEPRRGARDPRPRARGRGRRGRRRSRTPPASPR